LTHGPQVAVSPVTLVAALTHAQPSPIAICAYKPPRWILQTIIRGSDALSIDLTKLSNFQIQSFPNHIKACHKVCSSRLYGQIGCSHFYHLRHQGKF
jgi:hypothetical protein